MVDASVPPRSTHRPWARFSAVFVTSTSLKRSSSFSALLEFELNALVLKF